MKDEYDMNVIKKASNGLKKVVRSKTFRMQGEKRGEGEVAARGRAKSSNREYQGQGRTRGGQGDGEDSSGGG